MQRQEQISRYCPKLIIAITVALTRIFNPNPYLYQEDGSPEWKVLDQFIRPDLPETLQVGLTAYADWDSMAPDYPNYQKYNEQGASTQNADLVAYVESIDFRRPTTPRFPIATLAPQVSFDAKLSAARLKDLMAD
jgi:hypothetical protein